MAQDVRKLKDKAAQLQAKGKLEPALQAYREALELAPEDLAVQQKVAEVLQRLGRPEAVGAFESLARSLAQGGHLLRAIAACKMVLQLEPAHDRTQQMLADLYAQKRGTPPTAPSAAPLPAAAPTPAAAPVEVDLSLEVAPPAPGEPPRVPLFSSLTKEEFVAVLEGMEVRTYAAGEPVVKEGENGTSMFALVEGRVDVIRNLESGEQRKVAEMKEGDFFGEVAVLADAPRLATVTAAEPCVLLEFTRARMETIVKAHPRVGEVMKAFYHQRLLLNVLRSNPLFASLPGALKEAVGRAFVLKSAQPGDVFLTHGDKGDGLYVLLRGRCLPFHPRADGGETKYPEMREGEVFGEISLLLGKTVTATVKALTPCTVLWLSRQDFDRLVRAHPAFRSELVQMGFERLQRSARLMSGRFSHHNDTQV